MESSEFLSAGCLDYVCLFRCVVLCIPRQPEVTHSDFTIIANQYIFRFEVAVHYLLLMHYVNGFIDLP